MMHYTQTLGDLLDSNGWGNIINTIVYLLGCLQPLAFFLNSSVSKLCIGE